MTQTRRESRRALLAPNRPLPAVGVLLTFLCGIVVLVSAIGKLTEQRDVVELLDHVEVHGALRDTLPALQLAGGLAALISLVRYARVGVLALACLALYFLGAVFAHIRVGDGISEFAVPLGYVVVMAGTGVIRAATIKWAGATRLGADSLDGCATDTSSM